MEKVAHYCLENLWRPVTILINNAASKIATTNIDGKWFWVSALLNIQADLTADLKQTCGLMLGLNDKVPVLQQQWETNWLNSMFSCCSGRKQMLSACTCDYPQGDSLVCKGQGPLAKCWLLYNYLVKNWSVKILNFQKWINVPWHWC